MGTTLFYSFAALNRTATRIMQLNTHHSEKSMANLDSLKADVLLIQEPYFTLPKLLPLVARRHDFIFKEGTYARVGIYSSPTTRTVPLFEFIEEDLAAALIEWNDGYLVVASIYLDGRKTIEETTTSWQNLIDYCNAKSLPLLAGIDCNSHSGLWNCTYEDTRGEQLTEFIIHNNMLVHNTGSKHTWYSALKPKNQNIVRNNDAG